MTPNEMSAEVQRCAVDGCDQPRYCRGWCTTHYQRWRRHGDPLQTRTPWLDLSLQDRLWGSVDKDSRHGCWEWTGSCSADGYGALVKDGHKYLTHRLAYELEVGPIGDGFHIDHLCRNTRCCNPAHLEAVTPQENNARSGSPSAVNARKTRCVNGHPLSGDNLYERPGGGRACRECRRAALRTWRSGK